VKKLVIAEFMDAASVMALSRRFEVLFDENLVDQRPRLLASLKDAAGLIVRNRAQVNSELLAAAPRLEVVGRLGVGLDNIDVAACRARSIEVIPATGANSQSVAEYVIAAAMWLMRGAFSATSEMAAGGWPRPALSEGREIAGKTLGIVGFGGIGRLVAGRAVALGMKVLAHDPLLPGEGAVLDEPGTRATALDELLRLADVVSLHLPLEASTRNLINAERLALMKPGAILVNTARGGIVDEAALARALSEGRLGGAAVDVFEREPLPRGSPLSEAARGNPNLILSPHIAGLTRESNARVGAMVAERVAAALGG
jgi:(S)-sulfolactate dehydrogenase